MRPSIKDVAVEAGISVTTVSRALNMPDRVHRETLERIRAAIEKLGFRPDSVGRALREGRSRTLGIMMPTLANTVLPECVEGIERAARAVGYAVLFTWTGYDAQNEHQACELLLQHRVDGMILTVADAHDSRVLDRLDREDIPYVLVYNQSAVAHRLSVSVDNRTAAREAVEHIIALGHRDIRMLSVDFFESDRARLRYLGYCEAMQNAGLNPSAALRTNSHVMVEPEDVLPLLLGKRSTTALFCSNDWLAAAAIRALHQQGASVPEDISVVGFDGIALGQWLSPTLASVIQPSHELGQVAVQLLFDRIAATRDLVSRILAHKFLRGGTLASAANSPLAHIAPGDLL